MDITKSYYYKKFGLKCLNCKNGTLILDDIDFNFNGHQDEYFYCSICNAGYFVKVRFGRIFSIDFEKGDF